VSTSFGDFLQDELTRVPAVVARVHRPGEPPVTFARGVDAGARFDVGSLTKVVVTTTALMRLEVDVDAPVRRWLPDFRGGGKETVTVGDLLAHRGGLWEWWPLYLRGAVDPVAAAAALPLRHAPRSAPHYSDVGFMLLGAVIERESGLRFTDAARVLVLEPAGMRDSGFRVGDAVPSAQGDWIERRMVETGEPYPVTEDAAAFGGWRSSLVAGQPNDGNAHHAFGGAAGHAGLFATAADLASWATGLLAGTFVPRERLEAHLAPVAGDRTLGFRIYAPGVVGHGGFPGAEVRIAPAEGAVAVLLANRLLAESSGARADLLDLGPVADALIAGARVVAVRGA
jgi:serine-type D-Ala-D-Ala carboxypeptidase